MKDPRFSKLYLVEAISIESRADWNRYTPPSRS